MNLRILWQAEQEARAAELWYEEQRSGLGEDFFAAVDEAIQKIAKAPEGFGKLETVDLQENVRRARVRRFPYIVIYVLLEDDILILAVAHTSRRSDYWIDRMPDQQ